MNYTIKRMLVETLTTNFKITVKSDCAISACSSLPQPIKALAHGLSLERSRPLDRYPPQPVASIRIKQTFLSIKLASLLASEWQAARPSFWIYADIFLMVKTLPVSLFPEILPNPLRQKAFLPPHPLGVFLSCTLWFFPLCITTITLSNLEGTTQLLTHFFLHVNTELCSS